MAKKKSKKPAQINSANKLADILELEYKRHQKNIYQKLVLGPAHRLQSDLKNLADEGKSFPGVRELNELLAIKVREAWTELNTINTLLLPFECVLPYYAYTEDGDLELKLTSNLISLLFGKLDRQLTPLSITSVLESSEISVY